MPAPRTAYGIHRRGRLCYDDGKGMTAGAAPVRALQTAATTAPKSDGQGRVTTVSPGQDLGAEARIVTCEPEGPRTNHSNS